jgi:hypothetical protein
MSTLTAQILVGSPHPYDDGIVPSHFIFLKENDQPSWNLVRANVFQENKTYKLSKIVWKPTLENMLEDGLLMVAIHVMKNKEIIKIAKDYSSKIESQLLELYSDLNNKQRDILYQKCRELSEFPKIIISVFRSSTIEKQITVLEKYKMEVEVCTPIYSRLNYRAKENSRIEGSLFR